MIAHEPILKDSSLNTQLFENGYVIMPFLNGDEVDRLRKEFYRIHEASEVSGGLYVTSTRKDSEAIERANSAVKSAFSRAISQHIANGKTLGGTYISKPANETEPLHPHQDWNIVDETKYRSFTIWVPLQDVDDSNGSMYVLPGSHEWIRGYRHLTIPCVYGQIYDVVWEQMTPVHLKAGEALIFDHSLVHASKPNRSDSLRIAATHSLLSSESEMRFYWNNNGTVEEYECTNEYYITEEAKSGPGSLPKIKDVDFEIRQVDEIEFYKLAGVDYQMANEEIATKYDIWNRIKRLFS